MKIKKIPVRQFLRDFQSSTEDLPVIITRYGADHCAVIPIEDIDEIYTKTDLEAVERRIKELENIVKEATNAY